MKKNILFLIYILLNTYTYSLTYKNTDDSPDLQDYYDFAMNVGKYSANKENVIVYDKNGNKIYVIPKVPDFSNVADKTLTPIDDSQIFITASHMRNLLNKTNLKLRFMNRADVNLYDNYQTNDIRSKNNLFTESFNRQYSINPDKSNSVSSDFEIMISKILHFDIIPYEFLPSNKDYLVKKDALFARMGNGNLIEIPGNYNPKKAVLAGGFNKIRYVGSHYLSFDIDSNKNKEIFEAGTSPGDSGSTLFIYDEEAKKYYPIAVNSAGPSTTGYITKKDSEAIYTPIKTREAISDFLNNKIEFNNSDISITKTQINDGTTVYSIPQEEFNIHKIIKINNEANLTIQDNQNVNLYYSRIDFNENANISGNGTLKTAGIIIAENKKLTLNNDVIPVIRKLGKGTLEISTNSKFNSDINIGEGTLILNNNDKITGRIRIATGRAKIILNKDFQIDNETSNISFGTKGGILDLNSKSISLKNIYHLDNGANIINSNDIKSTFTFEALSPKSSSQSSITYLGNFKGNLDVEYIPNDDIEWELRGDTNITGDFNINKGSLSIRGDNLQKVESYLIKFSAVKLTPYHNKYIRANFSSNNLNLKNNTNLNVGRASSISTNIHMDKNSTLYIHSNKNLDSSNNDFKIDIDRNPDYIGEDVRTFEIENNKTILSGTINFLEDIENTNFDINLIKNHIVDINSTINGKIIGTKDGKGTLNLNSTNNISGTLIINDGYVNFKNKDSISNLNIKINENGVANIQELTNKDFNNILNRINENSSGLLSINGSEIFNITNKLMNYPKLYIGTNTEISLGDMNNTISADITNINIGGSGGIITIYGLNDDTARTINIGNNLNSFTERIILKGVKKNHNLTFNNINNSSYILEIEYQEEKIADNISEDNTSKDETNEDSTNKDETNKDSTNKDETNDNNINSDNTNKDNTNTDNTDSNNTDKENMDNTVEITKINIPYSASIVFTDIDNIDYTTSEGILLYNRDIVNFDKNTNMFIGADENQTISIESIEHNYNISSLGKTNIDFNLDNKNLNIDAQNLYPDKEKLVYINTSNPNYTSSVNILGSKIDTQNSKIELILNANNALGNNNNFTIKNGGILNLNGNELNMKLVSSNSKANIKNSSNSLAKLNINNEGTLNIDASITGNINLNITNANEVNFNNNYNDILADISISNAKITHNNSLNASGGEYSLILNNSTLITTSSILNRNILINNPNPMDAIIIDLPENETIKEISLANIILKTDATIKGGINTTYNKVIYNSIQASNKNLTIENQNFYTKNPTNIISLNKLILNNATANIKNNTNNSVILPDIETNNGTLNISYNIPANSINNKFEINKNLIIDTLKGNAILYIKDKSIRVNDYKMTQENNEDYNIEMDINDSTENRIEIVENNQRSSSNVELKINLSEKMKEYFNEPNNKLYIASTGTKTGINFNIKDINDKDPYLLYLIQHDSKQEDKLKYKFYLFKEFRPPKHDYSMLLNLSHTLIDEYPENLNIKEGLNAIITTKGYFHLNDTRKTLILGPNISASKTFNTKYFNITTRLSTKILYSYLNDDNISYGLNLGVLGELILSHNIYEIGAKFGYDHTYYKKAYTNISPIKISNADLNTEISASINPVFRIKNIDITMINKASIKYQPNVYINVVENINYYKNTPLKYSYTIGAKINLNRFEMGSSFKIGYNQTNKILKHSKNEKFTKNLKNYPIIMDFDLFTKVELIKDKSYFNANLNLVYNENNISFGSNIGITYKW